MGYITWRHSTGDKLNFNKGLIPGQTHAVSRVFHPVITPDHATSCHFDPHDDSSVRSKYARVVTGVLLVFFTDDKIKQTIDRL